MDVLGLKSVFAAFMGKIHKTSVRKLEPDEKHDEETRAVSVLASLFTGTFSPASQGQRVGGPHLYVSRWPARGLIVDSPLLTRNGSYGLPRRSRHQ